MQTWNSGTGLSLQDAEDHVAWCHKEYDRINNRNIAMFGKGVGGVDYCLKIYLSTDNYCKFLQAQRTIVNYNIVVNNEKHQSECIKPEKEICNKKCNYCSSVGNWVPGVHFMKETKVANK